MTVEAKALSMNGGDSVTVTLGFHASALKLRGQSRVQKNIEIEQIKKIIYRMFATLAIRWHAFSTCTYGFVVICSMCLRSPRECASLSPWPCSGSQAGSTALSWAVSESGEGGQSSWDTSPAHWTGGLPCPACKARASEASGTRERGARCLPHVGDVPLGREEGRRAAKWPSPCHGVVRSGPFPSRGPRRRPWARLAPPPDRPDAAAQEASLSCSGR